MNKKNNIGRNSLIIAVLGFVCLEAINLFYISNIWVHLALAAFEAAMVGAFADWFAVAALFREVPIPVLKNHTNIIVKSRAKLTNGVVDLVSNQWLSIDVIKEKIFGLPILPLALKMVKDNINFITNGALTLLKKGINSFSVSNITDTLVDQLHISLSNFNLPEFLSKEIVNILEHKKYENSLQTLLDNVQGYVNSEKGNDEIKSFVEKAKEEYSQDSFWVTLVGSFVDTENITEKLKTKINSVLDDVKNDKDHALRQKLEEIIFNFSMTLKDKDSKAYNSIESFKLDVLNSHKLKVIIESELLKLRANLLNDIENPKGNVKLFLVEKAEGYISNLEANPLQLEEYDTKIKNFIINQITPHHHSIGNLVGESMGKLKNEDLVNQLEDKVGSDLQYIRLNGAVVGGMVGVIVFGIKLGVQALF